MKNLNQPLSEGDRIICLYMQGETDVPPGTEGTVKSVSIDPFNKGHYIINVNWDNRSSLGLQTSVDVWKKIPKKIKEQIDPTSSNMKTLSDNYEIFEHFDWKFLRSFMGKIRKSGIINMFGSAPLIYAGKKHIERYYGEGKEDDDEFLDMLNDADKARDKMVQGAVSYMESKGMEINVENANKVIQRMANKMLQNYIAYTNITGNP